MMMDWTIEFLKAIGRFFLHPLFYYFILVTLAYGYFRIKRERRSFHVRVEDIYDEIRFTYSKGLLSGVILSVILFAAGAALPFGTVVVLALVTFFLSLTFRVRWLSAAFSLGFTFIVSYVLINQENSYIERFFIDIEKTNFSSLAILVGLVLVVEGVLVYRSAHIKTSPFLKISTRGLPIGNHVSNRTWMLPLLFLVPGGSLTSIVSWWPVLTINGEPFLLLFIPFFLGFHQRVQGSLPQESIKITAKRISILGAITTVVACFSIIWTPLMFAAIVIAIIGREFLTIKQRMNDDSAAFYFSKRDVGLVVLGTLPNSPAQKFNLQVGEIIMKVNGINVKTVEEFYEALQTYGASCKLEIVGLNGEVRFEKRAFYENEHHELGILFVRDEKKWDTAAV
ncbi:PDZ domain-containing protein [Metabacillus arenae]|uniref:PDZ domain-containing protein n=1 Tax=Metabacillus arenae TaxID=2771434 RepID=A0A926NHK3_9BACI|nr:PDZ domain-containing protein [Metabacillus arenae]MBD1381416.1 PDZ domain-containing protein [Metabacillus arenae]